MNSSYKLSFTFVKSSMSSITVILSTCYFSRNISFIYWSRERRSLQLTLAYFFTVVKSIFNLLKKKLGYLKLEWQSSHHDIKSHFKQKILLAFLLCLIASITFLLFFLLIFFWWLRHGVVINCGGQRRPHISPKVVDMQWFQERRQYSYFIAIFFFHRLNAF